MVFAVTEGGGGRIAPMATNEALDNGRRLAWEILRQSSVSFSQASWQRTFMISQQAGRAKNNFISSGASPLEVDFV